MAIKKTDKSYRNAMRYAALGTELAVMLGLGVLGGLKVDERLHTTPLFLLLFPVIALVITFVQLYKSLNKKKP